MSALLAHKHVPMFQLVYELAIFLRFVLSNVCLAGLGDAGSYVFTSGSICLESSCDTSEVEHGDCQEYVEKFISCSRHVLQRVMRVVYEIEHDVYNNVHELYDNDSESDEHKNVESESEETKKVQTQRMNMLQSPMNYRWCSYEIGYIGWDKRWTEMPVQWRMCKIDVVLQLGLKLIWNALLDARILDV